VVLKAALPVTHSGLLLGLLACADTDMQAAFSAAPLNFTPPTVEMPAAGQQSHTRQMHTVLGMSDMGSMYL
jgi:hypothetical protein